MCTHPRTRPPPRPSPPPPLSQVLADRLNDTDAVPWTAEEDQMLREAVLAHPARNFTQNNMRWKIISDQVNSYQNGIRRGKKACRARHRILKGIKGLTGSSAPGNTALDGYNQGHQGGQAAAKASPAPIDVASPVALTRPAAAVDSPMTADTPKGGSTEFSASELVVLKELLVKYPAVDAATGKKISAQNRFAPIKTEMTKRLPGCTKGKGQLRAKADELSGKPKKGKKKA